MDESFAELLRQLFPRTDLEIAGEMKLLATAVRCNNKPGELTVKFTLVPDGEGVRITVPAINSKPPQSSRESALFFLDEDGNLSRRDPRQMSMDTLVAGGSR